MTIDLFFIDILCGLFLAILAPNKVDEQKCHERCEAECFELMLIGLRKPKFAVCDEI